MSEGTVRGSGVLGSLWPSPTLPSWHFTERTSSVPLPTLETMVFSLCLRSVRRKSGYELTAHVRNKKGQFLAGFFRSVDC